jgi:hypothetical protein
MMIVLYDLGHPDGWQAAHRHRAFWGRRFTDIYDLGSDHVALLFRRTPDEGWRAWELVRLSWILDEALEVEGRAA